MVTCTRVGLVGPPLRYLLPDPEVPVGEVGVEVDVVVARSEPAGAFTAHLDDLVEQRAGAVLGEGVALPEAERSPIGGGDVRHAERVAGDRHVVGVGWGRRCAGAPDGDRRADHEAGNE